ncbi:MAG: rod shape-determining protein, partial [Acidimicrobiales bacterium]|nr:rod shape-determining protein [Acidimicrobiales bacterium]
GIVSNEPSVVAVQTDRRGERRVLAVGKDAKEMLGRTPMGIEAIRPMRDGVIADFEITEAMLRYFIMKVQQRRTLVRPRVIVCVPWGITDVEKRAVRESAESTGAREVFLIEEPMAAAIGAGLPVAEPIGSMIVDIGGGTTEVAVLSLGGVVASQSSRVGGDELDEAILQYLKKEHGIAAGSRTAEEIKIAFGSACPLVDEERAEISGRDLLTGLPRTLTINTQEIREAIEERVSDIIDAIKVTLDRTPPELAADIMERGITLSGGGSLLNGLSQRIRDETGMPVWMAPDPRLSVVLGAGRALEEFGTFGEVIFDDTPE